MANESENSKSELPAHLGSKLNEGESLHGLHRRAQDGEPNPDDADKKAPSRSPSRSALRKKARSSRAETIRKANERTAAEAEKNAQAANGKAPADEKPHADEKPKDKPAPKQAAPRGAARSSSSGNTGKNKSGGSKSAASTKKGAAKTPSGKAKTAERGTSRNEGPNNAGKKKNSGKPAEKGTKKETGKRGRGAKHEKDTLDTSSIALARGISHEERRKRQNRRDLLRIGSVVLIIALLVGAAVFAYRYTTVKTITVTGSAFHGEEELLSKSGIRPGRNIFFYNEAALRSEMDSIPDLPIRTVSVTKVMPDRIDITVADITPYAAIVSPNGSYTLISDDGYVLSIGESSAEDLIEIRGMTGIGFVASTYITDRASMRTVGIVKLLQAIHASGLEGKVRSIDISNSACVKVIADNNYTIEVGMLSSAAKCIENASKAYELFLPTYPNGGTLYVFPDSTTVDFTPAS